MEIRAKCKFDYDTIKEFVHLAAYRKFNPKKVIKSDIIICIISLLVSIATQIAFGFNFFISIMDITILIITALILFLHFGFPRIQYNSLVKMNIVENEYIFYDNIIKSFTKGKGYSGESELEYSLFTKVYETSKYFLLFQSNNQAFIVDKSTIEGGSADDIRNKLSSFVKEKYYICKY